MVRWCEWETCLPKNGLFPQMSHTAAMTIDDPTRAARTPRAGVRKDGGRPCQADPDWFRVSVAVDDVVVGPREEVLDVGKYDGAHAFSFLYEGDEPPPEEVIENLRRDLDPVNGPVYFASMFEPLTQGAFVGFAHVAGETLADLDDLIAARLWDAGVHSDNALEGSFYVNSQMQPMGPKRQSPRYCVISRVQVNRRPKDVMRDIAKEFDEKEPFIGESHLIGRSRVLVELGADSRESLEGDALPRLRRVPGVAGDETSIADTEAPGAQSSVS